jgi:hypothetical protein
MRAKLGYLFISALNNLLKKPFLLSLFIAALLWVNRTYGVSFVRLWPLLVPDVVLRLPAEVLWKLSGLRLPRVFYESFIVLGQAGALFAVWKVFLRARAALHRPPRLIQADQLENSRDGKSKVGIRWKKKVSRVAVLLLVLLIINGRCGRGMVGIVSLVAGVPVYTLPVSTEVSVESLAVDTDKDSGIRKDVEEGDIASRVNELMEKRRSTNSRAFPDSTLKLFPAHSADIVAGYLDDSNDSIIEYALAALKVVGLSPARTTLEDMMQTGQTKSGRKLSQALQRRIAEILARCGEPSAISHLEALGGFDRMDVSIWYDEQVNIEPTATEAGIQEGLIARFARYPRMVRPGRLQVKELPLSVSRIEAARVERIALEFMCAVSYLLWDDKATAKLTFSQDGKRARYSLELSHDWGPLAAGANEEYAILVKVSGRWVIVKCDSGYSWIS